MKVKSEKKCEAKTEEVMPTSVAGIKSGAKVMMIQSHGPLAGGEYEVDGFNSSGDVIVKTDKGLVAVPLEKIEVIEKAKGAASDKKASSPKQMEMPYPNKEKDFYVDPYGQLTINKIDTPLGKLAQRIIQAQLDIRRLEEQLTEDEEVMMQEMKKMKVTKTRVLGHQMVYQPAKTTAPKLIVKDLE